jgi:GNAT superfamily N-acetyltransferase
MSSSFWKSNPCSPSWTSFFQSWASSSPPKLLSSGPSPKIPLSPPNIPSCILRKATSHDLTLIPEFLERYFSSSSSCMCRIPLAALQNPNWEIYVVFSNSTLIGTIVRKWIDNLHVYSVKWPKAAVVDYFCVHPAFKKKGIGRWLLSTLQNSIPSNTPLPPHLILWDGLQPSYPPLSIGFYFSKPIVKKDKSTEQIPLTKEIWNSLMKSKSVWSEFSSQAKEVSAWKVSNEILLLSNSFHSSIHGPIATILYGSPLAIQHFSESQSPWGVLLLPSSLFSIPPDSTWSLDSPYQWISYNMIVPNLSIGDFPCLSI